MAKKLTQKQLNGMFKAYCEKQSEHYVSQKCTISRNTVRKYKRLEDWDTRIAVIQQKAQEKQDETLAEFYGRRIKDIEGVVEKVLTLIEIGRVTNDPASTLVKLVKAELLLRGEADSRSEVIDRKLKDVPTDMLLKMQKELIKGNGHLGTLPDELLIERKGLLEKGGLSDISK